MIVVDANIIAYFYLSSERTVFAEKAFAKDSQWLAPRLWRSEFRSALSVYVRRKMIEYEKAVQAIEEAEKFMSEREHEVSSSQVLALSQKSGLSSYDCEYVALAQAHQLPLVTCDKKIIHAFPGLAVSLEDFVKTD